MEEATYLYFCSACRAVKEQNSPHFEGSPHYDCNHSDGNWILYRPTTPDGKAITPIPQISSEFCVDLLSRCEPEIINKAITQLQQVLKEKQDPFSEK